MVSDLSLPPEGWASHPRFPQQVLLLGSHERFRGTGSRLIKALKQGESRTKLLSQFSMWKSAMERHEHYEEHKLYPFLEHRWGMETQDLSEGHVALDRADAVVRRAHGAELGAALEAHQDILLLHLDMEERRVIPALLALSAEEFVLYSSSPIRMLLKALPCFQGTQGCSACARQHGGTAS